MKPGRALTVVGLVLAGSLAWAGTALAHSLLVRSSPEANAELTQAPTAIEMWFSEPLETQFSNARLIDSSGQTVAVGAATIDPFDSTHMTLPVAQLQPGIYTVAYQTLSAADGHEWYGSFPFTLLNSDGSRPAGAATSASGATRGELPPPIEVAARWLALMGSMVLLGAPLFQRLLIPAASPANADGSRLLTATCRDIVLRLVWLSALAITLGNLLHVASQAERLGGLGQIGNLVLATRTGNLVLMRQFLVLAGLLATLILDQPPPLRGRERPVFFLTAALGATLVLALVMAGIRGERVLTLGTFVVAALGIAAAAWSPKHTPQVEIRIWNAGLLMSGAVLLTFSLGSHAAAGAGSLWAVMSDYVHLAAASVWMGGLCILPWLVWQVRRSSHTGEVTTDLVSVVLRFSFLASFAVFVLVVTGLFNSLVEIPSLDSLISTTYGRVLLVKLFLMALALQLAFLNNRLVHSRSHRLSQTAGLRQFHRQIVQETVLSLGLMLSVAVLVQTQTPRPTAGGFQSALPFNAINQADDLLIHVQVTPNQVGDNRFFAHLYHEDGSPVGDVQLVRFLFNYRDAQLGQAQADLRSEGQDTFGLEGAYLNQAGGWDLSVYVRRRGLDDILSDFTLEVRPTSEETVRSTTAWQNPASSLPGLALLGGLAAAVGLIPLLWRQPLQAALPRRWPLLAWLGGAMIVVGLGLALWAFLS
jgi:copper transport protein